MRELIFVLRTLGELASGLFLLRALLQVVRTDFRNPLAQAIVRLSNPVVRPLRRVLPPVGRLDSASFAAAFVVVALQQGIILWLSMGDWPAPVPLFLLSLIGLLNAVLSLYWIATLGFVLLSFIPAGNYHPATRVVGDLVNPFLGRLRRLIPVIGGIDFSPMALILAISVLQMVLTDRIGPWLLALG